MQIIVVGYLQYIVPLKFFSYYDDIFIHIFFFHIRVDLPKNLKIVCVFIFVYVV